YYSYYQSLSWAVLAFPTLAGLALLTLVPAARTPRWRDFKIYLVIILRVSVTLWLRERQVAPLAAATTTLGANMLVYVRPLYRLLAQTLLAEGLPWLAVGLASGSESHSLACFD